MIEKDSERAHETMALRLRCTQCGETTDAACECGVAYEIIRPGKLAAKIVTLHPDKSDRAIADDIGVSKDTVRRARESTGANAPVEKRIGKDGRKRIHWQQRVHPSVAYEAAARGMTARDVIEGNMWLTARVREAINVYARTLLADDDMSAVTEELNAAIREAGARRPARMVQ